MKKAPNFYFAYVLTSILLMAGFSGCSNNPVAIAQTPEQKIYAVQGQFVVAMEAAADIITDESYPRDLRKALQAAALNLSPVVESGVALAREAEAIRQGISDSGADSLPGVIAEMEGWLDTTPGKVTDFISAVRGAKDGQ